MALAAALALLVAPVALGAAGTSLYSGPGSRPGPDILYQPAAVAPQLTDSGIWHAPPILVSGATAYRHGEFLYQDWLYDDHGAHELPDPSDPRASGDTFSKPDGTYTYPTGPGYDNNAADLGANGDPIGQFDAFSRGFGVGDPAASGVQGPTPRTLSGGNMGDLQYVASTQTWGATPSVARTDSIDIDATNIAAASIDVQRAGVDCSVGLNIKTDGPISVTLPGCNRVVHAG